MQEDDVDTPVAQVVEVLHVAVVRKKQVDAGIVGVTKRLKEDKSAKILDDYFSLKTTRLWLIISSSVFTRMR